MPQKPTRVNKGLFGLSWLTPKALLLTLILVLLVGAILQATGAVRFFGNNDNNGAVKNGINYGPPTKQEKDETEEHKEDVKKQSERENNPPEVSPNGTPVISSWGQDPDTKDSDANGYIASIYEDGGTCTFTFTKGDNKVTKTSQGIKDVNKTICPTVVAPYSEVGPGKWQIALKYKSDKYAGTSEPRTLEVK